MSKVNITPADPSQCQAEITTGNFMTFGGTRTTSRCTKKPVFIAIEEKNDKKDQQRGYMSLCLECKKQMVEQVPANSVFLVELKS